MQLFFMRYTVLHYRCTEHVRSFMSYASCYNVIRLLLCFIWKAVVASVFDDGWTNQSFINSQVRMIKYAGSI